jgi:3-hydroxyacyl-CoA dehydrogenase
LHFFNPAPAMKLVEVVRTVATGPDVERRCNSWVRTLGKRPVRCLQLAVLPLRDLTGGALPLQIDV